MKHYFWMLIGCTLPLLLIFFAPLFNVSKEVSLLVFMLAMFACHFPMPYKLHLQQNIKMNNKS